jgi:hypothetical protein
LNETTKVISGAAAKIRAPRGHPAAWGFNCGVNIISLHLIKIDGI